MNFSGHERCSEVKLASKCKEESLCRMTDGFLNRSRVQLASGSEPFFSVRYDCSDIELGDKEDS